MKGERRVYIILRLCTNVKFIKKITGNIKKIYQSSAPYPCFGPLLLLNGTNVDFERL